MKHHRLFKVLYRVAELLVAVLLLAIVVFALRG
jgi:hypothetical protein